MHYFSETHKLITREMGPEESYETGTTMTLPTKFFKFFINYKNILQKIINFF